ncbi:MAG: tetratricopeptide repeat protein [Planctomycetota bacterium]
MSQPHPRRPRKPRNASRLGLRLGPRRSWCVALTLALAAALLTAGCATNTMLRENGYEAIQADDWPAAHTYFARAVRQDPRDGIAHYYLGRCELELGDPLAAQLALERAYTLKGKDPEFRDRILKHLAQALYEQGEYEKLNAFLGDVANESALTPDHLRHARYLVLMGDNDAAQLAFRKAAFFAPEGDPSAMIDIADFYQSIGDVPNERLALRYAYWIDPEAPDLGNRLRQVGVVPGPTAGAEPPRPEMLR